MIPPMAGDRDNNDVIRRVHQRAEEQAKPRYPLPSPEPIYEWFATVYGLLTDIRRSLSAFIATSEWLLEPVLVPGDPMVGRGRKKRGREGHMPSVGWRLSMNTVTHFDTGLVDTREVTDTYKVYLLVDGRLLGSSVMADDQFPAMLDNPQVTEMIVTLYVGAGLRPPQVPPPPEALGSQRAPLPAVWKAITSGQSWSKSASQARAVTGADALYAFQAGDGTWFGPHDQLPDGQFGVGVLSFHPGCAWRNRFYGQELRVRYGPWDGDASFHAPLIRQEGNSSPMRVRMTNEVIGLLFDQR